MTGAARPRRRNQIAGQFTPLPLEVQLSPPWRVLSLSGHRVIHRVAIELRQHAGHQSDGLCVTYDDFEEYGIDRHAIAPAIRECVALGLLRVVRHGRGGNAEFREAARYQTTFLHSCDGEPSNDWKRIKTLEQAQQVAVAARRLGQAKTETGVGNQHRPQWGEPTPKNGISRWGKPPLL